MDTTHGHTMDGLVTAHHGHNRGGLDTPRVSGPALVEHREHVATLDDLLAALGYPPRPQFMSDALCRERHDVDYFSAKRPDPAKAVCAACLVRAECLQWALDDPTLDAGDAVLGGLTVAERRALRRQQAGDPEGRVDPCGPAGGPKTAALRVLCEEGAQGTGGGSDPCGLGGGPKTAAVPMTLPEGSFPEPTVHRRSHDDR